MLNQGKDQKAVFRKSVPVAIEALDVALRQLSTGNMEAVESLRRIANQLQINSSKFGYNDVAKASAQLASLPDVELTKQGRELVKLLYGLLGDHENPSTHILIIDSDLDSVQKMESLLQNRFHCVITVAHSAHEAMHLLADLTPNLILLGLILPDRDGRSLLVDLKRMKRLEDTQIVMISALDVQVVRSECLLLGADDLLGKPCSEESFLRLMGNIIETTSLEAMEESTNESLPNLQVGIEWLEKNAKVGTLVALLDVDHFHEVFDHEPFEEAERILSEVAARINGQLDEGTTLYGGDIDDFLLILPEGEIEQAKKTIRDLQQVVSSIPFTSVGGASYPLTFSAGLVKVTQPDSTEQVLTEGRHALAQAKRKGDGILHTHGDPDQPPRILLAEDDPMIVKLVQHRLQRAGVEVVAVNNGRDALEKGLSLPFDLIILDVKMPVHDGFEVTRRLRLEPSLKDVPIVLFTSLGSEQDLIRGFELGVDDYITKPFSPAELLARLLHLIRKRP
ncbi:response regulator [bacterium]|nr:response regulator [bacterium]